MNILSQFGAWALHIFCYWIIPVPIVIAVEIILRRAAISKRKVDGINFELHYSISRIADKVRRLPIFGKTLASIAHLAHLNILYSLVMKEGKRQWLITHPNQKRKNAPRAMPQSEITKKSVPSVESIKKKSNHS